MHWPNLQEAPFVNKQYAAGVQPHRAYNRGHWVSEEWNTQENNKNLPRKKTKAKWGMQLTDIVIANLSPVDYFLEQPNGCLVY